MEYVEEINNKRISAINARFDSNLVYQEHMARYLFAKECVDGKLVLDLGCGIGDGTFDLAERAKNVIGIELDKERLKCAQDNFKGGNINYLAMDGCSLGFKDNVFDAVISFEVIEHLEDQDAFLCEIKRILKDTGMAIISTPNKTIVKIEGSVSNSSHISELDFIEYRHIFKAHFRKVEFFGQKRGRGVLGITGILHSIIKTLDIFKIRRLFPQSFKNDISTKMARATGSKESDNITIEDVCVTKKMVKRARNIIAVCGK